MPSRDYPALRGSSNDKNRNNNQHKLYHHDIYMCVIGNKSESLRRLLERTEVSCDFSVQGKQIINIAVENADLRTVTTLLDYGASSSTLSPGGSSGRRETAFSAAIRLNKYDMFLELLRRRPSDIGFPRLIYDCVLERRHQMLDAMFLSGAQSYLDFYSSTLSPKNFMDYETRLLGCSLHLVVASNVSISHWRVRELSEPHQQNLIKTNEYGLQLLLAAGCRFLTPTAENHHQQQQEYDPHIYYSIPSLFFLCRISIRRHFMAMQKYEIFCRQIFAEITKTYINTSIRSATASTARCSSTSPTTDSSAATGTVVNDSAWSLVSRIANHRSAPSPPTAVTTTTINIDHSIATTMTDTNFYTGYSAQNTSNVPSGYMTASSNTVNSTASHPTATTTTTCTSAAPATTTAPAASATIIATLSEQLRLPSVLLPRLFYVKEIQEFVANRTVKPLRYAIYW